MSPSSSGSWDGAGADIIDLDRYMRGNVRPSRTFSEESQRSEQLVVDSGKPNPVEIKTRYKHYSHDSGVSDGSYHTRRSRRPHRRPSNPLTPAFRELPAHSNNPVHSSDSARQFRAACERALLDQQRQIARVAEVCERLARENNKDQKSVQQPMPRNERPTQEQRVNNNAAGAVRTKGVTSAPDKRRIEVGNRISSDTSDLSSSSFSSDVKDVRNKEISRAQQCKTYKIIMSKLDELNRRFAPRARALARETRASSSSVSVCDKLVATEPERKITTKTYPVQIQREAEVPKARPASKGALSPHVTQDFMVGVSPRSLVRSNIVTESIVYESSIASVAGEAAPMPTNFDLDDPVHLYTQAKRLRARSMNTPRAHSVDANARLHSRVFADARSRDDERSSSFCAVCLEYFRSLRQCIVAPLSDITRTDT